MVNGACGASPYSSKSVPIQRHRANHPAPHTAILGSTKIEQQNESLNNFPPHRYCAEASELKAPGFCYSSEYSTDAPSSSWGFLSGLGWMTGTLGKGNLFSNIVGSVWGRLSSSLRPAWLTMATCVAKEMGASPRGWEFREIGSQGNREEMRIQVGTSSRLSLGTFVLGCIEMRLDGSRVLWCVVRQLCSHFSSICLSCWSKSSKSTTELLICRVFY